MEKPREGAEPFRRFEALTKKRLPVPKKELDENEAERAKRKRREQQP